MRHRIQTTKQQQFINISSKVAEEVRDSNVQDGIAIIFVPHTTAGVTINENADPGCAGHDFRFGQGVSRTWRLSPF
jgi:secondary thiamine-phosphate synthase enzyme